MSDVTTALSTLLEAATGVTATPGGPALTSGDEIVVQRVGGIERDGFDVADLNVHVWGDSYSTVQVTTTAVVRYLEGVHRATADDRTIVDCRPTLTTFQPDRDAGKPRNVVAVTVASTDT